MAASKMFHSTRVSDEDVGGEKVLREALFCMLKVQSMPSRNGKSCGADM